MRLSRPSPEVLQGALVGMGFGFISAMIGVLVAYTLGWL
jgi:hypothetical protein